jgi:hypothetical protein
VDNSRAPQSRSAKFFKLERRHEEHAQRGNDDRAQSQIRSPTLGNRGCWNTRWGRLFGRSEISQKLIGELVPLIYKELKATA